MQESNHLRWPVLSRYAQEHAGRIALPIGGIGTGTVSLGGRGNLQDWEIVNRPAKGFTPERAFFVIRTATESAEPVVRALEGILPAELYEGWSGSLAANAGLPRFRHYEFESAYPFGTVRLTDPDVPVDVRMEAFNPLIPVDADLVASRLPCYGSCSAIRLPTRSPLRYAAACKISSGQTVPLVHRVPIAIRSKTLGGFRGYSCSRRGQSAMQNNGALWLYRRPQPET